MRERLQKVLAAAGIASRRQAEEWIRAGRVTVDGRPASLGQRVDDGNRIAIDGRKIRLTGAAPAHLVLLYHRAPGESLREAPPAGDAARTSTYERLPAARGRRWLPLSALAPSDGGLELFTTDGTLRAAASRLGHELPSSYAVRVRGTLDETLLAALSAAAAAAQPPFVIEAARHGGGEGRNQWLELDVRGARGRDLRALLTDRGLEVSRVLRTRYGPVVLDRAISRGRHRELAGRERDALYAAVGLQGPGHAARAGGAPRAAPLSSGSPDAGRSRPRSRGRAGRGRSA
jgi:23S rRNA pseudouridine2605 synthase